MLNPINVKYWKMIHTTGYEHLDDINAKCDVCGDSSKSSKKKRLHLYKKSSYDEDSIKCFNCGYTATMYSYLKNYHPTYFSAYSNELGFTKISSLKDSFNLDSLDIKKEDKRVKLKEIDFYKLGFIEDEKTYQYLKDRGFSDDILESFEFYLSVGNIQLEDKSINLKDFIVIPLKDNSKVYGFYSRSLINKTFYTYLPQENSGYKIWNWFNISKESPLFIFEAIFNALSTTFINKIALMGSDIPSDQLKLLKAPVFIFDNDTTGRSKALKYAELGYKVVVFPQNTIFAQYKDCNDMLKDGLSSSQISQAITEHTYSGIKAIMLLKLY